MTAANVSWVRQQIPVDGLAKGLVAIEECGPMLLDAEGRGVRCTWTMTFEGNPFGRFTEHYDRKGHRTDIEVPGHRMVLLPGRNLGHAAAVREAIVLHNEMEAERQRQADHDQASDERRHPNL